MTNKQHMDKINIGMKKLSSFRIEKKFLIDKEVLTAASKVLYLIFLLWNNKTNIEKYSKDAKIIDMELPTEIKKRMKIIRKMNPEAYFYISRTL